MGTDISTDRHRSTGYNVAQEMKCYVCDGEMFHDLPCPEWQTDIRDVQTLSFTNLCPECNTILSHRKQIGFPTPTAHYCKSCGTQWTTQDLLAAINMIILQTREA